MVGRGPTIYIPHKEKGHGLIIGLSSSVGVCMIFPNL